MTVKNDFLFPSFLDVCTSTLLSRNYDFNDVVEFETEIYNRLENAQNGSSGVPYGFLIIQNNSVNAEYNDLCPVYKFRIDFSKYYKYYVFYCEHLLSDGTLEIVALRIYPANNDIDKEIIERTPIFGMRDYCRAVERKRLIASVKRLGYYISDNAEKKSLKEMIIKAKICLEYRVRIRCEDRRYLERHGYYVNGRDIEYVPSHNQIRQSVACAKRCLKTYGCLSSRLTHFLERHGYKIVGERIVKRSNIHC